MSFGSVAMGFPQNTYQQQRALSKQLKSKTLVKYLETSLKTNIQSVVVEDEKHVSIIELLANYVVELFTEKLINKKVNAFKKIVEANEVRVAVRKDFEYHLAG